MYNREIFRVLDLMKMDMVNFTIQMLRPHLQEHSVEYERKKFQELLDKLPGIINERMFLNLLDLVPHLHFQPTHTNAKIL